MSGRHVEFNAVFTLLRLALADIEALRNGPKGIGCWCSNGVGYRLEGSNCSVNCKRMQQTVKDVELLLAAYDKRET